MNLLQCFMRQSTCYQGTTVGVPVGILFHDTGAGNPNLKRYVQPDDNAADRAELLAKLGTNRYGNDWNHISIQAGVNGFIGKLADGSVATAQTQPWNYRPWGCGSGKNGSCNGSPNVKNSPFWIQFEICDDGYGDRTYFEKVYREAVELTAYLCKLYGFDPMGTVRYNGVTVPTILCHADSYKLGLGSNHGDVLLWFEKYGKSMQDVRNDVTAILKEENDHHDGEEETEMRYQTLGDLRADKDFGGAYLPTVEKLITNGVLKGKGGDGDGLILDLSEDAVRLLVVLDRSGVFGK